MMKSEEESDSEYSDALDLTDMSEDDLDELLIALLADVTEDG